MIGLLRLVPWWAYPAAALALVVALQAAQVSRLKDKRDTAQAQLSALKSEREAERQAMAASAADRIARIQRNHATIVEDYHAALETRRAAAARAESAASRLRNEAASLRQRVEAAPIAQRGEAASEALGVHADVLGRCESAYRRMAAIADASRAAGEACERAYEVAQ